MAVFSRFLRYFLEVARQGSIRRAAEALHVSASAIDRQILQAEQSLGVPLFERLPSGVRATAAGEALLAAAGRWRRDYERVQGQIDDLVGLRRGRVRIAVIDALCQGFAPRVAHEIRRDYPGVVIEFTVCNNVAVAEEISRGDADFGLMLSPESSKDILVHGHRDIVLGVAARPDHPLATAPGIRLSACLDPPLIRPSEPLALAGLLTTLEAATGVRLEHTMASNSIQMIKSLVLEGAGIGILTSLDVMEDVRLGRLAFVAFTDSVLRPIPLALCVGHARQLSHAARLALDRMEQALQDAPLPGRASLATSKASPSDTSSASAS